MDILNCFFSAPPAQHRVGHPSTVFVAQTLWLMLYKYSFTMPVFLP